ncbi:MAG: orc1/cdc6 family replication initiation protein [Thaumarchaeota archaeon]|jgi:cell division control protein 6|nr:orc1/cdc6 family replication initiation protein [Candidatus Terraquivivens yellowstonensis]MCL7392365.1 orc1/cdc6 family replication initiation protein [Candidatus Terraquivivens yellowstonensis]MCL7397833.1 orc1/cdc6 family replication initiation protein [Candidatus Terraquivivens yellowstonensis]MCL7400538.1 orc1/cdc6 family replication initiation protein [Candidatus Terraquivivens yellowstonensis]
MNRESDFQWKIWGARLDPLSDLLSTSSKKTIFKNRNVLRSDYLPDNLPHRWEHIRQLGEILAPALNNARPSNVFIYGKTGTGKTAVVKYTFKRFNEETLRNNLPLKFIYINCRMAGTEYRVLTELCSAIGQKVPFTGLSKAEVFNRFVAGLSSSNLMVMVCLDEVDILVKNFGDDLLYELTRVNESLNNGQVVLIGVSNDLMFKNMLDPRVLSSLSEEEIVFHPYTASELMDILSERAVLAFNEGTISQDIIALCAALAAAEHGDARRALDLLRVAGEVAERAGAQKVEEKHVRVAQGIIERGRVFEALSSLPLHSKLVLLSVVLAIKNGSEITSGTLYTIYKELCELIGIEPLTDRRTSSLLSELNMLGVLDCELVSLGRYGRTRKVFLTLPIDEVVGVFEKDDVLSNMLGYVPTSLKKRNT